MDLLFYYRHYFSRNSSLLKYNPQTNLSTNTFYSISSIHVNPQSKVYPIQIWKRMPYEKTCDKDGMYLNVPINVNNYTLVYLKPKSSLCSPLVVGDKQNFLLNYLHKWLQSQFRSLGFLNWFHPWIVVRHHYFYQLP